MSLRGKLTEEAPTERQFAEINELENELERTEILREQLIRKKELALRKVKDLDEGNANSFFLISCSLKISVLSSSFSNSLISANCLSVGASSVNFPLNDMSQLTNAIYLM
jgi:hypothetical protein